MDKTKLPKMNYSEDFKKNFTKVDSVVTYNEIYVEEDYSHISVIDGKSGLYKPLTLNEFILLSENKELQKYLLVTALIDRMMKDGDLKVSMKLYSPEFVCKESLHDELLDGLIETRRYKLDRMIDVLPIDFDSKRIFRSRINMFVLYERCCGAVDVLVSSEGISTAVAKTLKDKILRDIMMEIESQSRYVDSNYTEAFKKSITNII